MGTVYAAEDSATGRPVAIKVVRSQVLYDAERRERFLQGILVASEVRHPGMCPILEIGDDENDFFVVMPYLDGHTLEQHLERKPIAWRSALQIAIPVGESIEAAHALGALHRGLKSSNVWLQGDGTILVSDCGIARFTEIARKPSSRGCGERARPAETLVPMAALAYMSPEQVRGEPVDARTDIFSFGALLYEMLTGRHPFDARNSLSRMSAILEAEPPAFGARAGVIPARLQELVRKALAKNPAGRFQTMTELLRELRSIRDQVEPYAPPPPRPRWRTRVLAIALWGIFLLSLAAALWWYFSSAGR